MSGTWISIVVAIIAAAGSCIGSLISAKGTRSAVLQKLELTQALQNERIESYQRSTNEKIDRLSAGVDAQAAYGTQIAVLETRLDRLEQERSAK